MVEHEDRLTQVPSPAQKKLKKLKKKLATLLVLDLNERLADKKACISVQKKLKKKLVRL